MNMQKRAEHRSILLHQAVVNKLLREESLWDIPLKNLSRWKKRMGELTPALQEWEDLLNNSSHKELASLLIETSPNADRLRSSTPFSGILTAQERLQIFQETSRK